MEEAYYYWTNLYPNNVILRKEGVYYTARNESARVLHDILGFNLTITGRNSVLTSSPALDAMVKALKMHRLSYIIIEDDEIKEKVDFDLCDFKSLPVEIKITSLQKQECKDLRGFASAVHDKMTERGTLPSKREWTEDEDEIIRNEYTAGMPLKEIAEKLDCPCDIVSERIVKLCPELLFKNEK